MNINVNNCLERYVRPYIDIKTNAIHFEMDNFSTRIILIIAAEIVGWFVCLLVWIYILLYFIFFAATEFPTEHRAHTHTQIKKQNIPKLKQ